MLLNCLFRATRDSSVRVSCCSGFGSLFGTRLGYSRNRFDRQGNGCSCCANASVSGDKRKRSCVIWICCGCVGNGWECLGFVRKIGMDNGMLLEGILMTYLGDKHSQRGDVDWRWSGSCQWSRIRFTIVIACVYVLRVMGIGINTVDGWMLKVASSGTDEARRCQEWATRDKGLKRCKGLKSEVSNWLIWHKWLTTCLKSEVSNWGLLASIYSLIYVSGEQ